MNILAGLSQKAFGEALGVSARSVRAWESRRDKAPTGAPNDARIEFVLLKYGVVVFADPTLGVRLLE